MLKSWFSKTALAAAAGAVMGYVAALGAFEPSVNAAVAPGSVEQASPALLKADAAGCEAGCSSKKPSLGDQLALANHNQVVAATLAQSGQKPFVTPMQSKGLFGFF